MLLRAIEERNRSAWDAYAKNWRGWVDRLGLDAAFFRRGGVSFDSLDMREEFQATASNRKKTDALVRKLAGPVRGRRILVAPCGGGEEALSWANLGAKVTGVDQSAARLDQAGQKAKAAGVRVLYLKRSLYALKFPKASFDMVYTGHGSLVWLPKLEPWAEQLAGVLKPGGRFLLFDFHPLLSALTWNAGRPRLTSDYFNQKPRRIAGPTKGTPQMEVNWKFSDILNALTRAGLAMKRLEELPPAGRREAYVYRIPHRFILLCQKPR